MARGTHQVHGISRRQHNNHSALYRSPEWIAPPRRRASSVDRRSAHRQGVEPMNDNTADVELPAIPGYRVWKGRVLLHARWLPGRGPRNGRPRHVVAPNATMLITAVKRRDIRPFPQQGRWTDVAQSEQSRSK